ncbi:MAG: hypothetical protein ACYDBQ_01625 [Thermoplasmatota archaeon]
MALLRPCSTSAGFLATPEQSKRLDMARLRAGLVAAGFEMVLDAGIILIVRRGMESSVYDTGKVLLKTTDAAAAATAYAALEPILKAAERPLPAPRQEK